MDVVLKRCEVALKLKIILVLHHTTKNNFLNTAATHNSLTVIPYTSRVKQEWDQFVDKAINATFLFKRDFMEYHQDRFEDASLLFYKKEQLVAVLPANSVKDTYYSHQGLTYGGLVLSRKAKLTEVIPLFKQLLVYLEQEGITQLQLKQLPTFYAQQPNEAIDYLAFICEAKIHRVDVASVIDNRRPLGVQSNRREGVKKADRAQLDIEETTHFSQFWNDILLPNLAQRHQATPTHSLEEIQHLQKRFPKNITQFNVRQKGKIVGGATIFETATTAHVQYISANAKKQELGTLDFLFDYLINTRYANKDYFDFGISNENQGRSLNTGLNYWKECFGARSFVHRHYLFDTSAHHHLDTLAL